MTKKHPVTGARAGDEGRRSGVDLTTASAGPVWRQYLRAIGPGLVTGASDDDPSAIVTYASAGARTGLGLLWTCAVSFPLMLAVQVNADRVALATGQNVGTIAREHFGRLGRRCFAVLLTLHLLANVVVVAADLTAVGSALHLLHAGPATVWAVVAGVGVSILIATGSFVGLARVLKILCLALLGYIAVLAVVDVSWADVGTRLVVPHLRFDRTYLALTLAVLGATLPPYVFLWQGTHRLEELREEPEGGDRIVPLDGRTSSSATRKIRTSTLDVTCGMVFAVAVMFAVMVATAATVGAHPRALRSAADAARALRPVAGSSATALFAVGVAAAGLLAIPVIAGAAASALAGLSGRSWGYSRGVGDAPAFYGLVGVATAGGMVAALAGADPVSLLLTAATVNGITAAPLLTVVMVIAGRRDVVGDHRTSAVARGLGWLAVGVMGVAAAGTVVLVV